MKRKYFTFQKWIIRINKQLKKKSPRRKQVSLDYNNITYEIDAAIIQKILHPRRISAKNVVE